jgi:hypothetical protein
MLFFGAALKELGEEILTPWFAVTFGPVIIAVEDAYVE